MTAVRLIENQIENTERERERENGGRNNCNNNRKKKTTELNAKQNRPERVK